MSAARHFSELHAWQAARTMTLRVYALTAAGPSASDFGFKDQLRRAAVSVMSNIAEGFGRGRDAEFIRFLDIARGSACEVQSLLILGCDLGYYDKAALANCAELIDAIQGRIAGLTNYLSGSVREQQTEYVP
ncbi:MAG: four helix bundle protein [Planctomycetes bacterium]|nr:four helix bundle protein [Planctomycetota bacterium]